MNVQKLTGLIAAPFTPMKGDGSINPESIEKYYELLKRNRVSGAFINGSSGEGAAMTQGEKKIMMKAWRDAVDQDTEFKVIALVGGTSVGDAIELSRYAKEIGMYAVALTGPYYFKSPHAKELAETCMTVANAVPELPFYYYHIPVLNGNYINMIDLLREIDGKADNFVGIKYTHEDFMDFSSCLNFKGGQYDMLWARDENILPALALGSKGAVGSTYNYAAPLYNDLIDAFEKNDLVTARKLQQKSIDMIQLLGKYGGIATGKAYMKLVGVDCGEFRLPVYNMDKEQFEAFKKEVEALGFDDFKSV